MIPTKYYLPLSLLIVGVVGVNVTGTTAEKYLAIEILGACAVIMMYFGNNLE